MIPAQGVKTEPLQTISINKDESYDRTDKAD